MVKEETKAPVCEKKHSLSRLFWLSLGVICVTLGAIGIVLPIIPTTPFLLAAAGCFCKSSSKMYNWLMNNRIFGNYIRNYKEGKGVSLRVKVTALSVLWATMGISILFVLNRLLPDFLVLPLQLVMFIVGVCVSIHILRLPTLRTQ